MYTHAILLCVYIYTHVCIDIYIYSTMLYTYVVLLYFRLFAMEPKPTPAHKSKSCSFRLMVSG